MKCLKRAVGEIHTVNTFTFRRVMENCIDNVLPVDERKEEVKAVGVCRRRSDEEVSRVVLEAKDSSDLWHTPQLRQKLAHSLRTQNQQFRIKDRTHTRPFTPILSQPSPINLIFLPSSPAGKTSLYYPDKWEVAKIIYDIMRQEMRTFPPFLPLAMCQLWAEFGGNQGLSKMNVNDNQDQEPEK